MLSSKDHKRTQSIDSVETNVHEMNKELVWKKEKIKLISIIKRYKKTLILMLYKKNIKEHNPNWPQIPDHPYRILTIGGYDSGEANSLFNLINHQSDVDNIYLYSKFLIKKCGDVGTKHFNDSKAFIEH